eukprot:scaffold69_cov198-Alexandrium_tamarense.AAC.106
MGGDMPSKIQSTYTQGEEILVNVTLTAFHKGHFEFAVCPISYGEIPTKECFDSNKLTFIEDLTHGANYDANHPERAYLAPLNDPDYVPNYGTTLGLIDYSFKMRLPQNVYGDLVLLQWNKLAEPANMDFRKVQRVNFAFFQTDDDVQPNPSHLIFCSHCTFQTDSWADPNLLFGPYNWNPAVGAQQYCSWDTFYNALSKLTHYTLLHPSVCSPSDPSLGGWTLSDPFPAMAASSTARAKFAQNCVELILEYGFDGIDIDWEYPGYAEHSGTSDDTANFRLLLDDVRAALDVLGSQTGKFYGLTAALPCGPSHINNMDIQHVASTLSELNLMTYDFHGAFSSTTGTNAPLYYQGWGEEGFSVDDCVRNWLAGGGSRDKINIGLPFYGRSFLGATDLNQPHSGADQTTWGIDDGTPQYFNIVAQLPFMNQVWDEKTWTQWAWFENGGAVSFDNENAICAKTQYAIEEELGGFIIWELSGDVMDDLSTPLLDVVNKKLADPSYNCGTTGIYPDETSTTTAAGANPTVSAPSPSNPVQTPIVPGGGAGMPGSFTPGNNNPSAPVSSPSGNTIPAGSSSGSDNTIALSCDGGTQNSFNSANSESYELLFTYELHRYPLVSSFDASKDVKSSMMSNIAESLQCADSPSSVNRRTSWLRSNSLQTSREHVIEVESMLVDIPDRSSPCSIALGLNEPSVCEAMIGSITVYLNKGTPESIMKASHEELSFLLRTGMASGRYETSKIVRVIFVEDMSVNPSSSNADTNGMMAWAPKEEGTSKSTLIAVVLGVLLVIVAALAAFMFIKNRKRKSRQQEVTKDDSVESPASQVEDVWQKALRTYIHEPNLHAVDPLASQSKRRIAETSLEISSPDGDANVEVSCDAESNTYLQAFDKRRSRGSDRPPASSQPDAKENSSSDSDSNSESDDSSSSSADSDEEKEKDGNCSSANVQEDKTTLGNDVVADPPGESAGGEVNDSEAADAPTEQSTLDPANVELPEVSSMKISQLKKELIQHGIDSSTFCEKQEFIDAVAKARDASSTANGNYFRVEPGEI